MVFVGCSTRALLTLQSVLPAWPPVLLGFVPGLCSLVLGVFPLLPQPLQCVLPAQPAQGVLAGERPGLHSCQGEPWQSPAVPSPPRAQLLSAASHLCCLHSASQAKAWCINDLLTPPSSQPEIILVQNNMMVSADAGNEMPFSWRIKEYLEEMWLEAQYIQNTEGESLASASPSTAL